MQQVKHLLSLKGKAVYAVAPDAPVYEAIQQMAEKNVGALAVIHRGHPAVRNQRAHFVTAQPEAVVPIACSRVSDRRRIGMRSRALAVGAQ